MPVSPQLYNSPLRMLEFAFAALVTCFVSSNLYPDSKVRMWRFIYTEAVAGISILLAVLWYIRCNNVTFIPYPLDLVLFALWMVAFGILINFVVPPNCGHSFGDVIAKNVCNQWKATVAFCFLSSVFWLVSAILGIWFLYHEHRAHAAVRNDGAMNAGANVNPTGHEAFRRPRANTDLDA